MGNVWCWVDKISKIDFQGEGDSVENFMHTSFSSRAE